MNSAGDIISQWVCPAAGTILITLAFSSPLKSILKINRERSLGDTNSLPYAVMLVVSISWMLYGAIVHNYFVYCGNLVGVVLGLYYTMVCYKYSSDKAQDTLTCILMAASGLFFTTGLVTIAAPVDHATIVTLWGAVSVALIVVYYASPLATVATVLRTRNSSSLHWPMCTLNTINGMLWFVYGLAVKDWFICAPNGVGAVFNVLCVILCTVFRHQRASIKELSSPPQAAAACDSMRLPSIQLQTDDNEAAAKLRWKGANKASTNTNSFGAENFLCGQLTAANVVLDIEAGDQGQQVLGTDSSVSCKSSGASGSSGSEACGKQ